MSAAPDAPAPPPAADKGPRYLVLLAVTVVAAFALGLLAAVAVAALLSFLPSLLGLLFGLVLSFGLPIFLAVRAALALKRKGRGTLLRRLVTLFLLVATQLAILGSVLQFTSRGTGHLAAAGAGALHGVGGIPVLSGLLEEHARREHVPLPYEDKKAPLGPDGGPLAADAADGGVRVDDGGVRADAGAPAPSSSPSSAPALSPRTAGGAPARTVALAATLASGAPAVVVVELSFGGVASLRFVSLSAFAKHGNITALSGAEDGGTAVVLGGTHVVVTRPGRSAELVRALSRDAKVSQKEGKATFTYDVQTVRDIAIGPGGDLLVVADALDPTDASGALHPMLLHLAKGQGAPTLVRRAGQAVPGSEESAALGFDIKPARGDGRVVLVESFRDGPDAVTPNVQGESFTLNPQRLLTMRLDQPKVLQEVARSDTHATGIADRTLQAFADAVALPDGRVIFDANFVEEGPSGWLFQWRAGGAPAQAIGAELFASRGASFRARAPRTKLLDVEQDGGFVFAQDGALAWSSVAAPKAGMKGVLGATTVERRPGAASPGAPSPPPVDVARGAVARVDVPFIANGAKWVLALAHVDGVGDALVLASSDDVKARVAQLIVWSGQQLANAPGEGGVTLASLKLPVQDELLWTPAPAEGAQPVAPFEPAAPRDAGAP